MKTKRKLKTDNDQTKFSQEEQKDADLKSTTAYGDISFEEADLEKDKTMLVKIQKQISNSIMLEIKNKNSGCDDWDNVNKLGFNLVKYYAKVKNINFRKEISLEKKRKAMGKS